MILSKMTGIHETSTDDGAVYYEDDLGNDWYPFRDNLLPNKPVIVVNPESNKILSYYNGPDPSYIGLFGITLDVYQLDSFPDETWEDFAKNVYNFIDGKVVLIDTPVAAPLTKEQIYARLAELQESLDKLS